MKWLYWWDGISLKESPPAREAWIEMINAVAALTELVSPPAREAWIEMLQRKEICLTLLGVASREGGVD